MQMEIYYSYACRDSYLVYAWLKRVEKSRQSLDIHWRPFAIQMDEPNAYWTQPWESANSELRGFIAAEAAKRQGSESFSRFHDAAIYPCAASYTVVCCIGLDLNHNGQKKSTSL